MPRIITLTGLRFGRLVVTGRSAINSAQKKPRWVCLCDCGQTTTVNGGALQQGITESCGCLRRETTRATRLGQPCPVQIDVTGQRFGKLVALHRTEEKYHGGWVWKWQCDCGVITGGTLGQVKSGHKASCGCSKLTGEIVRNDKVRAEMNAAKKDRYRTDPRFRLCQIISAQMRNTLKKQRGTKIGRTFTILGYTPADLEKRLRATIPKGCTWDDFMSGALHIEHITPLSAFNFSTQYDHDFKLAWALSNLRLLPSLENWSKGATLLKPFQPSMAFGSVL